jgi:putative copper export protein
VRKELCRRAVRRFSRVATVAVIALISTGTYAILLHVPNISALFTTPHGNALLAKLVLLVFLLAVGAANLVLQGRGPSNAWWSASNWASRSASSPPRASSPAYLRPIPPRRRGRSAHLANAA